VVSLGTALVVNLDYAAMIGEEPIESLFPEICGIRNGYQSGSKQPHSKGSAIYEYSSVIP
jgi:hypothetical protein